MGGGPLERVKVWAFPSVGYLPHSLFPSPDRIPHTAKKKVALIAFRQILPKILSKAYIFSNIILSNLKKLIGNKSLNTKKQCPAGLSSRIIPLNLYGKPCGWGRISANSQKFINFPHFSNLIILLNKFTSSTIKSFIPSPSNSSFHLITLYKLHL